jgi:Silicon transporter
MWAGVPEAVSVIICFVLMSFVGMMEDLQIALFAVVNISAEELESKSSIAMGLCPIANHDSVYQTSKNQMIFVSHKNGGTS